MYPFANTAIENKRGSYEELHRFFADQGFDVGGNWNDDHGFFDLKLDEYPALLYVRVPVFVEEGTFGDDRASVRLGTPFLLRHQFTEGIDETSRVGVWDAAFDQFSPPADPDAKLEQADIERGLEAIKKVNAAFVNEF